MLILVLKQNKPWTELLDKLHEEFLEVVQATSKENFAEELEDLKQIITTLQFKLEKEGIISMDESNRRHIEKMKSRGWEFEKIFSVEEWK